IETYHAERQSGEEPLLTFWECLQRIGKGEAIVPASAAKKITAFAGWLKALMESRPTLTMTELFHRLLDATAYVRELKSEGTEEALARVENLEEFESVLQEFEEDQLQTPKSDLLPIFIERTSLASDGDQNDRALSAVQMMTLHSSKGLEFPVVFLVGVEEGLFPSLRPWEDADDREEIEEERRLCYVGMTRARQRLFMTHVQVRRLWGQITYQEPARFFQEFSDDLVKMKNFVGGALSTGNVTPIWKNSTFLRRDSPPATVSLLVGKEIRHPEYGAGVVVSSDGAGDEMKVTVRFKGHAEKRFLWKYLKASQL
ncbi:MAG: 3'-5' exonuclease, partial [Bdellovibrionota bacterium]